jgi:DNA-binding NarL/FixJ family response regulator
MSVPLNARILLADDHEVVRDGLRLLIDAQPDLQVAALASNGAEAVERTLHDDIDLVVLDVAMPKMTGLNAARRIAEHRPKVKMLILSMHDNELYFFEALRAGAGGYVLKSAAGRDLVEACRAVLRGEPFIYPSAVRALVRDYLERARSGEGQREDPLSQREREVTKMVAEGCTTREIAQTLTISEKTVERHRSNVLSKLGMRDRVELTHYAIRRGLVEP